MGPVDDGERHVHGGGQLGRDAGEQRERDGAATSALLSDPEGVTLTARRDLYIADTGNNRIMEMPRRRARSGDISMTANDMYTVAGSATGTRDRPANGGAGDVSAT